MRNGILLVLVLIVALGIIGLIIARPFANTSGNVVNNNVSIKNGVASDAPSTSGVADNSINESPTTGGNTVSGGGSSGGGSGSAGANAGGPENGGRGAFLVGGGVPEGATSCSDVNLSSCDQDSLGGCGWLDSQKVKCRDGPCVRGYINICEACANSEVLYWTSGDCPFNG